MEQLNHIEVWKKCLAIIRDNVNPGSFRTWFEPIEAKELLEGVLTISVPSEYFPEYIEEHFIDTLSMALREVIGPKARLVYDVPASKGNNGAGVIVKSDSDTVQPKSSKDKDNGGYTLPQARKISIDPNLNYNYSFDNFVEGDCNRLARAAGVEISKNPGHNAFNPLFIYGGPGMGKTHLIQAVGIAVKEKYEDKTVLYVTASRFQTHYVDSVISNKLTEFLHYYQSTDVLIIDDVQEFAQKQGTQKAFFQIFNYLHQLGKQLVLSCDKAPSELKGLEQRLLSRFKWGLTTELTAPDFKTRVAILKMKAAKEGLDVDDSIINYIAQNVTSNVRELEGTLISLIANSKLTDKELTLDLARESIDRIVSNTRHEVTLDNIQDAVCDYFDITRDKLISKSRKRDIVQARQIAMYLCRSLTSSSLDLIGTHLGGKDHATVLYACKTIGDLLTTDRSFKQYISDIEKIIYSNI